MTDRVPPDGGTHSNTHEMMSCTPEELSYIHQKHEQPTTLGKKVMREFDRGTRGWFLRKVVLGHGGGGVCTLGWCWYVQITCGNKLWWGCWGRGGWGVKCKVEAVVDAGVRAPLARPPVLVPPLGQRQGTLGLRTMVLPCGALPLPQGVRCFGGKGAFLATPADPAWRLKSAQNPRAVRGLSTQPAVTPAATLGVGLGGLPRRSPEPNRAPADPATALEKWRAAWALPNWTRSGSAGCDAQVFQSMLKLRGSTSPHSYIHQ